MFIGRHFFEYAEGVGVEFWGPSLGVFLKHVALQIGCGEPQRRAVDSDAQSFGVKANSVGSGVGSYFNMLVTGLRRNGPGCVLG